MWDSECTNSNFFILKTYTVVKKKIIWSTNNPLALLIERGTNYVSTRFIDYNIVIFAKHKSDLIIHTQYSVVILYKNISFYHASVVWLMIAVKKR